MTTLTYAQLKGLWLQGSQGTKYHTAAWATLMAAIAEAESGGNTDALNPSDNGGTQSSYGLWQVSTGTHTPPSPNWADPAEQVHLAIGKLDGQGLTAWGTYDSGAYRAYMNGATAPDPNVPGNPGGQAVQTTAASQADCLMANPFGAHVPIIGWFGAGGACLFTRSNARAFIGAGFVVAGGIVAFPALGMLAAGAGVRALAPVASTLSQVPVAGQYVQGAAIGAGLRRNLQPKPRPVRPQRQDTRYYDVKVGSPKRPPPPPRPAVQGGQRAIEGGRGR